MNGRRSQRNTFVGDGARGAGLVLAVFAAEIAWLADG
jgi:hypothetical protein